MAKRIPYESFYLLHMVCSAVVTVFVYLKPILLNLLLGLPIIIGFYICFIIFVFWRPTYYGYLGYVKLPELIFWQLYYIALMIGCFAFFYQANGITNPEGDIVKDVSSAIYFSIVTFTTLGYGDFKPTEQIRIVAASEALLGYICLGLFIATVAAVLHKIMSKGNNDDPKLHQISKNDRLTSS